MAIYYKYVNRAKKEYIDLGEIPGQGSIKRYAAFGASSIAPQLLAYAMSRRWHGDKVEVINDCSEDEDLYYESDQEGGWTDITITIHGEWSVEGLNRQKNDSQPFPSTLLLEARVTELQGEIKRRDVFWTLYGLDGAVRLKDENARLQARVTELRSRDKEQQIELTVKDNEIIELRDKVSELEKRLADFAIASRLLT